MKLKDLKQGMVGELRSGESITVLDSGYYSTNGLIISNMEEEYNEDLTHKENIHLDIMEITFGDEVVFKRYYNKWYVPEYDEEYFYISSYSGGIISTINWQHSVDIYTLNNNRVFKTKEEAEKRLRQQQATLSVERWIAENDVEVDVYDTNVLKYGLYYNIRKKEFEVMSLYHYICVPKQFILSSKEKAKQLIKEREKELKIMFGVEE